MGGNAFLSPWHFPRGAHGGQTCWEAIVCSELAFTGLQECVFTVALILVSPDLTISPQSSQDKVGHYLEIITQGSSCNQHQCCLSPAGVGGSHRLGVDPSVVFLEEFHMLLSHQRNTSVLYKMPHGVHPSTI